MPLRVALVGVPGAAVAVVLAINLRAGITVAVLVGGVGAVTAVYAKNRTDRHNAAVERGDIRAAPDPHLRPAAAADLGASEWQRLTDLRFEPADVGRVQRFDGGWLVGRRNRRDVAVVLGDEGGCALFDPRSVMDRWAVHEYLEGRGHEPLP